MGMYICEKCDEYRDTPSMLVRYFDRPICEECFNELETCTSCLGCGLGRPGEDARCNVCKGRGSIDICEPAIQADFAYGE